MQFVYLCRKGPNEELRYSIRSVVKNFPNASVLVVGEAPSWYDGDLLFVKQNSAKYANVSKSLNEIARSPLVKDEFILMNDDFYFLKKKYGHYHEGSLNKKYEIYMDIKGVSSYNKKILDTLNKLKKMGYKDPLSYELHIPFPVEKSKLLKIVKYGNLLWRSLYGNIFEIGGSRVSDVKVYGSETMSFKSYNYMSGSSCFLSTNDFSFKEVLDNLLSGYLQEKTIYEKD
jgi:hypothetical protein